MFKMLYSLLILVAVACSLEAPQQSSNPDQNGSANTQKADSKKKKKKVERAGSEDDSNEEEEEELGDHTHAPESGQAIAAETSSSTSTTVAPTTSTTMASNVSTTTTTKPAMLGLKGVTLDPADPTRAIFRIPAGTAGNAWNDNADKKVEINLTTSGVKVLRIINDDTTPQTLHMDAGMVCGHQGTASAQNGFYDCVIDGTKTLPDGSGTKTYSHGKTGNPKFFFLVTK